MSQHIDGLLHPVNQYHSNGIPYGCHLRIKYVYPENLFKNYPKSLFRKKAKKVGNIITSKKLLINKLILLVYGTYKLFGIDQFNLAIDPSGTSVLNKDRNYSTNSSCRFENAVLKSNTKIARFTFLSSH